MRHWVALVAVLSAGCTPRQPVASPRATDSTAEPVEEDHVVDVSGLDSAWAAADAGDLRRAADLADSVYEAWLGDPAVRREEARDLAELLDEIASEDWAARFLVRSAPDVVDRESSRLRRLCESLAIPELRELLAGAPAEGPAAGIVAAELARALALGGRATEGMQVARAALDVGLEGDDRRKAEDVLEGRVTALSTPVRIGLVLPGSGRFALVGEQILEGALLAVEEARSASPDLRLELVVRDDSSSVDVGIRGVEELGRQDVVAVVGPIRSDALISAALRREVDDLTLISPTASQGPLSTLDAYTIWDARRRVVDPTVAVATWMVREVGLDSLGVLYPEDLDPRAAEAIREAVTAVGGEIIAVATYPPDSMTFEAPISVLAAREPSGVIVVADGPRTVLQVAPQIVYYGLRRWVVGGDASWSDPEVVRRLEPSYSDFRLVGTYVDRMSPDTEWKTFERAYEARYRKSLPSTMFGALGYDAVKLALVGAPVAGVERRGAVGRAIRRMEAYDGATGRFRVDSVTGELVREAFVRVIRDGGLVVPDAAEMLEWAKSQRELEEFLRELEECKEDGDEADCSPTEEGR